DKAIKRGTGELEGVDYEEVSYEGYGPGGVALYIECLTDNQNRTVAEVRHILEKNGGNLAKTGSVAWQFDRRGQIYVDAGRYHEDAVLEAALMAGGEDVRREDNEFVVSTEVQDFHQVQEGLKEHGLEFEEAELAWIARNEVAVGGRDAERLLKLLELLDDHDDVQKVHSNGDIDEEVLAEAV
ncbi:MAG TPA: YebC/PmpR family DNA-binding transcriptional regulator, partial [Longimicrobiales bacterium]|nr:YebC/PmpR family DNA-binding transcriptional regulator [Longimicrobiales bacterium]